MSLGLDPPQVAAGGPSPSFKGTCAADGRMEGRGGKRRPSEWGLPHTRPGTWLALSRLLISLKCPRPLDGSSAFSLDSPSPSPQCALWVQWPVHHSHGLLRCSQAQTAAPFPQGEGREAPLAPACRPHSLFLRASLASAGLALRGSPAVLTQL